MRARALLYIRGTSPRFFPSGPRTVVHRRPDVALRAKIFGAVVLRKDGHSVSMGKDRKGSVVFEWVRLTLKS